MSLLRKIEKSLDQRMRAIFSGGNAEPGAREAVELYRDALDQIASRVTPGKRGDRLFPFNLVTIELRADDPERKAALETLFDPGQIGDDIRTTLKAERVTAPEDLTVAIKFPEKAQDELRVVCERTVKGPPATGPVAVTPARVVTVTGVSSIPECYLDRARVNLGRVEDVADAAGRTIRHNELFFPEEAHEANLSVSRSHAHIAFDAVSGEWRIFDDGSSVGTTLFRGGKRVDVPPHAGRGVALRSGDEIYLGQVRLRFDALIS
jgi:FHA domain